MIAGIADRIGQLYPGSDDQPVAPATGTIPVSRGIILFGAILALLIIIFPLAADPRPCLPKRMEVDAHPATVVVSSPRSFSVTADGRRG